MSMFLHWILREYRGVGIGQKERRPYGIIPIRLNGPGDILEIA